MPSPFPGMDPFLESQMWDGFHTRFITTLSDALVEQVRPKYVVDVERYVFVRREETEEVVKTIAPDVYAAQSAREWGGTSADPATATIEPVTHRIPLPQRRQPYLVIRTRRNEPVVTVIELLSPWNKTPERGVAEYLAKRANVLRSTANLVELDLLRGGQRLPTVEPLQAGDFYAFVARCRRLPEVDVFAWTVRDRLPRIPIPLAEGDPDAWIDLRAVFTTTYDRAGYDYSLYYDEPVQPAMTDEDAAWLKSHLPA